MMVWYPLMICLACVPERQVKYNLYKYIYLSFRSFWTQGQQNKSKKHPVQTQIDSGGEKRIASVADLKACGGSCENLHLCVGTIILLACWPFDSTHL